MLGCTSGAPLERLASSCRCGEGRGIVHGGGRPAAAAVEVPDDGSYRRRAACLVHYKRQTPNVDRWSRGHEERLDDRRRGDSVPPKKYGCRRRPTSGWRSLAWAASNLWELSIAASTRSPALHPNPGRSADQYELDDLMFVTNHAGTVVLRVPVHPLRRPRASKLQTPPLSPYRVTLNSRRSLRKLDEATGPAYRPPLARSFFSRPLARESYWDPRRVQNPWLPTPGSPAALARHSPACRSLSWPPIRA